jgi:hypothetical protein
MSSWISFATASASLDVRPLLTCLAPTTNSPLIVIRTPASRPSAMITSTN